MSRVVEVQIHLDDGDAKPQLIVGDHVATRAACVLETYAKRDEGFEGFKPISPTGGRVVGPALPPPEFTGPGTEAQAAVVLQHVVEVLGTVPQEHRKRVIEAASTYYGINHPRFGHGPGIRGA